jgi:5'-nucleotidase
MYSLDGTPVDCACFGITSLNIKFDLLVSGCNNGENVGYDTLYSGTIGAGIEGIKNRTKSIAFSTPRNTFENFKNNFDNVFDYILEHDLISNKFLLSVNFPYGSSVKGIKVSKLSYRNDKTFYNNVNEIYYLHREIIDENLIDTDFYYLNHHIVSLTPIKKNLMDDYGFEELNKKTSR